MSPSGAYMPLDPSSAQNREQADYGEDDDDDHKKGPEHVRLLLEAAS